MIWEWFRRGDVVDSLLKFLAILFVGGVIAGAAAQLATGWWATLSQIQQLVLTGGVVVLAFLIVNFFWGRVVGVTLFGIFVWLVGMFRLNSGPDDGREIFESGTGDTLRRAFHRPDDETVWVDDVYLRDPYESAIPQVNNAVSAFIWGQTRHGKSVLAKALSVNWPDGTTIAHALSSGPASKNEFERFYEVGGYNVWRFSTANSTHRWDPFLDFEESIGAYRNIAQSIFHVNDVKSTGWDEPAKMMILAALVVTGARHGDFAYLKGVLEQDADSIVEAVGEIDAASGLHTRLLDMDDESRSTALNRAYQVLLPLLETDLFNADLPSVSFREVFKEAKDDRVLVLDSIRKDRAARGFWRFLIETAIDLSYEIDTEQRFMLDEFDKLPEIRNLGELASAGASDKSRGIFICQNKGQVDRIYTEAGTDTIWSNSPNRVTFHAGDKATSEKAITELGKYTLTRHDVSYDSGEETVSTSYDDKYPMPSSELTNLDKGEALIQSDEGWWLCDLTEHEFVKDGDFEEERENR